MGIDWWSWRGKAEEKKGESEVRQGRGFIFIKKMIPGGSGFFLGSVMCKSHNYIYIYMYIFLLKNRSVGIFQMMYDKLKNKQGKGGKKPPFI